MSKLEGVAVMLAYGEIWGGGVGSDGEQKLSTGVVEAVKVAGSRVTLCKPRWCRKKTEMAVT